MSIQLRNSRNWLLQFGVGAFLCVAVGCKTTGDGGPNLNGPKAMGPGNQIMQAPSSPAYANLNGQGPVVNSYPGGSMNNSSAMMQRPTNNGMQGVQLPPVNPMPNNQINMPTQYSQQGYTPNVNLPMNNVQIPSNQMPMPGNQMQMQMQMPNYQMQAPNNQMQIPAQYQQLPPNQLQLPPNYQQTQPSQMQMQVPSNYPQPPLMNTNQGPMLTPNIQSMNDLQIPDRLPATARDVVDSNGPSLMPAIHQLPTPTLEPAPSVQKDKPVRVLAEYTPPVKSGEPAKVITTPVEHQPVLEAPITPVVP